MRPPRRPSIFTTTPSDYDWFFTTEVAANVGTTAGGKVEIETSRVEEQRARYASGCHMVVDETEWAKLVGYGLVTVACANRWRPRSVPVFSPLPTTNVGRALARAGASSEDLLLMAGGPSDATSKLLGPLRLHVAKKENLLAAESEDAGRVLMTEAMNQRISALSADHREAVTAFVEKRDPRFSGR